VGGGQPRLLVLAQYCLVALVLRRLLLIYLHYSFVFGTIQIRPISVYLRENCPEILIKVVSLHMRRIRELDIAVRDLETIHDEWLPLSHLFEGTAPVLMNLPTRFSGPPEYNKWEHYSLLPSELDTPVLQSFSLRDISLGQLADPIVHLTELILEHNFYDSSMALSRPPRIQYQPHRIVLLFVGPMEILTEFFISIV
jgi:hypothetical protein